jgi:sec-independent protein translocase protein TatA
MKIEGWHIVIIIALAILLFGAPKLPGLARSVGQSLRIFKSEVKQMKDENNTDGAAAAPTVDGRITGPAPTAGANGTQGQHASGPYNPPGTPGGSSQAPGGTPSSTP